MTTIVKELSFGRNHEIRDGAPCEWSAARGATHTLITSEPKTKTANGTPIFGGTRPAILKKTVLHVGVDEGENETIIWEKWQIRQTMNY